MLKISVTFKSLKKNIEIIIPSSLNIYNYLRIPRYKRDSHLYIIPQFYILYQNISEIIWVPQTRSQLCNI